MTPRQALRDLAPDRHPCSSGTGHQHVLGQANGHDAGRISWQSGPRRHIRKGDFSLSRGFGSRRQRRYVLGLSIGHQRERIGNSLAVAQAGLVGCFRNDLFCLGNTVGGRVQPGNWRDGWGTNDGRCQGPTKRSPQRDKIRPVDVAVQVEVRHLLGASGFPKLSV